MRRRGHRIAARLAGVALLLAATAAGCASLGRPSEPGGDDAVGVSQRGDAFEPEDAIEDDGEADDESADARRAEEVAERRRKAVEGGGGDDDEATKTEVAGNPPAASPTPGGSWRWTLRDVGLETLLVGALALAITLLVALVRRAPVVTLVIVAIGAGTLGYALWTQAG